MPRPAGEQRRRFGGVARSRSVDLRSAGDRYGPVMSSEQGPDQGEVECDRCGHLNDLPADAAFRTFQIKPEFREVPRLLICGNQACLKPLGELRVLTQG